MSLEVITVGHQPMSVEEGLPPLPAPNWIDDEVKPLLDSDERSVIDLIIRQTYKMGVAENNISLDQFRYGIHIGAGSLRSGTGLGRNKIRQCIQTLSDVRVITRVRHPFMGIGTVAATEYAIQADEAKVDFEWLKERHMAKAKKREAIGAKATEARARNKAAREAKGA